MTHISMSCLCYIPLGNQLRAWEDFIKCQQLPQKLPITCQSWK
jgi:hypothetical protein